MTKEKIKRIALMRDALAAASPHRSREKLTIFLSRVKILPAEPRNFRNFHPFQSKHILFLSNMANKKWHFAIFERSHE